MSGVEIKLALIFALFGVTFILRWIFGRQAHASLRRRRLWASERRLPRPSGR